MPERTGSWWWRRGAVVAALLLVIGFVAAFAVIRPEPEPEKTAQGVRLPVPEAEPSAATPLEEMRPAPVPPEALNLPLIEDDSGALPWRRHAVPVPPADGRPRIAIVIDDLGVNAPAARRIIALAAPLTLSFMTYAEGLEHLASDARAAGHELMLHVPMEPGDPEVDPGPRALKIGEDEEAVLANLSWGLDRMSGYVGINNHMGSRFTADPDAMRVVLMELRRRGLLFLDSRTAPGSSGEVLAAELGIPTASRDVFLDHERSADFIRGQLDQAEAIARRTGGAIAIGHPYPETIEALEEWLPTLEEKGIQLVPVSAVVREPVLPPAAPLVVKVPHAG